MCLENVRYTLSVIPKLQYIDSHCIYVIRQVHKGPVKCMQFDALHIVSGGVDCCVCITDVATGEVLQSLRGHTGKSNTAELFLFVAAWVCNHSFAIIRYACYSGHVLAVAFDSERIISASGDNTVRYWTWGKKEGPKDKYVCLIVTAGG